MQMKWKNEVPAGAPFLKLILDDSRGRNLQFEHTHTHRKPVQNESINVQVPPSEASKQLEVLTIKEQTFASLHKVSTFFIVFAPPPLFLFRITVFSFSTLPQITLFKPKVYIFSVNKPEHTRFYFYTPILKYTTSLSHPWLSFILKNCFRFVLLYKKETCLLFSVLSLVSFSLN